MASEAAKPEKQKLGLAMAVACVLIIGAGLSLGLTLLAFVLEARGESGLTIGLITAVGGVATMGASPLMPWLIRRIGVTACLLLAVVLSAASFVAFYWAEPLWLWFMLRFVNGIGLAILLVVTEFWITSLAPQKRRSLTLGIYVSVESIGFALGPAILAATGSHGFTPFAIGAALMLLAGVPVLFGMRATPELEKKPSLSLATLFAVSPVVLVPAFVFGAIEGGMNLLPVYGLRLGLGEATAALLLTAVAIGNIALQVPIGWLGDRFDRNIVLLLSGLVTLAAVCAMAFVGNQPAALFAAVAIWGGAVPALYALGLARLASQYEDAQLATATAAFVTVYTFGRLIGPPAAGFGMDIVNPQGFAIALALFLALQVCVAAIRLFGPRGAPAA